MSQPLIDRNIDLKKLMDDGYSVEVRGPFLLVHDIPYVTSDRSVLRGTLVSTLNLAGDKVTAPQDHVVHFIGGQPCHKDGSVIQQIVHQVQSNVLDQGLTVDRSFSNKPAEGYSDYYHKMATYSDIISGPAFSIDSKNTPRRFLPVKTTDTSSVFAYHDTASSRAGISALTRKLEDDRVGIIGLGGTGAYILDLVSKTPVRQIHLFDGDIFLSHNAFRAPGAASLEELQSQKTKVRHFTEVYSKFRTGITAHENFLSADNLEVLGDLDFVFVAIDSGDAKRLILQALEKQGTAYIDCGMGIEQVGSMLTGQVRVTTSTDGNRDHVWNKGAISFADNDRQDAYSQNIQIAELNALNAVLAVIKWKKLRGFYLDLEGEMQSVYPIDGNIIINAYKQTDIENTDAP